MKQPIKKNKNIENNKSNTPKVTKKFNPSQKKKRWHPKYGTSKLEEDFAKQFLDKLGVKYQYQFEAKDIGRYYDFYLPEHNLLLEIDGDFWHGNPLIYKEEELRGHQKRAQRVDEHKTKWALMHGIPILHIWENDIRKNPKKVMDMLRDKLNLLTEDRKKLDDKKRRH